MPDTKGVNVNKSRQWFCPLVPRKLLAIIWYSSLHKMMEALLVLFLLLDKRDICKYACKIQIEITYK